MKAIILAAGRGSRMKHLTDDRPKCLVKLKGKALLDWQLNALKEGGIHDIAIVTGYHRERLNDSRLTEFYNFRWAETNMVTSLSCADTWLHKTPCIVWFMLWKKRFGAPLLDADSTLAEIGNKPKSADEIGGQYMGLLQFSPDG